MQNPSVDSRVIDNSVILLSLLVTRHHLKRHGAVYPQVIKRRLIKRIESLIEEYRNPSRGIDFNDPGDCA